MYGTASPGRFGAGMRVSFFEEICAIPHGSRNTKTISDYLVRFAQERGLRFRQDEWNNVVIFQPGTPGV